MINRRITSLYVASSTAKIESEQRVQDIALCGGAVTFTLIPTSHLRWKQAYAKYRYRHAADWCGVWHKQGRLYVVDYAPCDHIKTLLVSLQEKSLRFIYFWPLEVTERLLRKAADHPWQLIVLLTPLKEWVLMAYHHQQPLFCRTLSADVDMPTEILETQAYLKRFGYEKNAPLRVWIPQEIRLRTGDIHVYVRRPWVPLKITQLAKAQQLARIPQWISALLMSSFLFLIIGLDHLWEEKHVLCQQLKTLSAITLPPLSTMEQRILSQIQPYWQRGSGLILFSEIFRQRAQLADHFKEGPRPRMIHWQSQDVVLAYGSKLTHSQKRQLHEKFPKATWQGDRLHLGVLHE